MFNWKFSSSTNKGLINFALGGYYGFIGILILSMYFYPGSHHKDDLTQSYSLSHNFLSDLGMTITYSGSQNFISSTLFVFATVLVFIGLTSYFLAFASVVNRDYISLKLAQLGSVSGIICGFSFMGVGFTPHNYYLNEHMFFVKLGFQLFLVVMLCHTVSIFYNKVGLTKKTFWINILFMFVLLFHIYLLNWGPSIDDKYGLLLKVVWQKVTVVGLSTTIFFQAFLLKSHICSLSE